MIENDTYLAEVFPKPPLVAYRRPKNLKDFLIRAKLPSNNKRPTRKIPGMHTCKFNCDIFQFIIKGKTLKAHATNMQIELILFIALTANTVVSNMWEKLRKH